MSDGIYFNGCVFNNAKTMNFYGPVGKVDTYQETSKAESGTAEKNNTASADNNSVEIAESDCCDNNDNSDPLGAEQYIKERHYFKYYFEWDEDVEQFYDKIAESKSAKEIVCVALLEFWEAKLGNKPNGSYILRKKGFIDDVIEIAKEAGQIKENRGLSYKNMLKHIDNIIVHKITAKELKKRTE